MLDHFLKNLVFSHNMFIGPNFVAGVDAHNYFGSSMTFFGCPEGVKMNLISITTLPVD